jgi:hypothetical protein
MEGARLNMFTLHYVCVDPALRKKNKWSENSYLRLVLHFRGDKITALTVPSIKKGPVLKFSVFLNFVVLDLGVG